MEVGFVKDEELGVPIGQLTPTINPGGNVIPGRSCNT